MLGLSAAAGSTNPSDLCGVLAKNAVSAWQKKNPSFGYLQDFLGTKGSASSTDTYRFRCYGEDGECWKDILVTAQESEDSSCKILKVKARVQVCN